MNISEKIEQEINRAIKLKEQYDKTPGGTVRSIVIGRAIGKARARINHDDREGMKASIRELHELE